MPLPEELKRIPQWVCAMTGSKCPMKAYEPGAASTADPSTWSNYATAEETVNAGIYDYVGWVFHDNGIVGIDIDRGFDGDGLMTPETARILSLCHSYTETSRSGRGFHILLKGTLPFEGKNNQQGLEIYRTGRYFILTGNTVLYPPEIVENQEAIDEVVDAWFQADAVPRQDRQQEQTRTQKIYTPLWELPKDGKVRLRPDYPKIAPGSRNISLTSLAGSLHGKGYTKQQIYEELVLCNQIACDPPLLKKELQSIVNSVTRYER